MRNVGLQFGMALASFVLSVGSGPLTQSAVKKAIPSATLCDLAEHPERFADGIVSVRGTFMGRDSWIEDFTNASCSAYVTVIVVYPGTVKPHPDFTFEQDDSSARFDEGVQAGKSVEATFRGRLDIAYVWQNHARVNAGTERGYGPKNEYGARIVLQRICDVVARPRPRK